MYSSIGAGNSSDVSPSTYQRSPSLLDLGMYLSEVSRTRWLTAKEIYLLLTFPSSALGIPSLQSPPPVIQDGTLCLYDDGTFCKQDNIVWAKKKGQPKLQETYTTLKVHGVEAIRAVYIKGGDNANFRRRIYRLNQSEKPVTVVHYRESLEDEKAENTPMHPLVHYFLHQNVIPKASNAAFRASQSQDTLSTVMAVDCSHVVREGDNTDEYFDELLYDLAEEGQVQSRYGAKIEMIDIVEFAPTVMRATDSQRKLLVCISHDAFSNQWKMVFSSGDVIVSVPVELVQPGALKLYLPSIPPGSWKLYIINESGRKLSNDSWKTFTIIDDDMQPTLRKRLHSITSPMTKLRNSYLDQQALAQESANNNKSIEAAQYYHNLYSISNSYSHDDFVRENKIRIVEKLGSMKSALLGEDTVERMRSPSLPYCYSNTGPATGAPYPSLAVPQSLPVRTVAELPAADTGAAPSGSGDGSSVEWLDDTQLSALSNPELESLMDSYIMAVVKELVQLAAVDDELKAEIDSLDANGYSLFHYCCLYNLTSLIPVLIARGAHINQTTSSGCTALHLAVAAGHIAVAQLLLESGVDANQRNVEGMCAYDISVSTGRDDIARLLFPFTTHNAQLTPATTDAISKNGHPTSLRVQSISSPDIESADVDSASSTNTRLLHDAIATLSLTDKCALSISLSQRTPKPAQSASMQPRQSSRDPIDQCHSGNSSVVNNMDFSMMDAFNDLDTSYVDLLISSDDRNSLPRQPYSAASNQPLSLHPYPDALPPSHGSVGGDRSPPVSSSLPRVNSNSSMLGFANSKSSQHGVDDLSDIQSAISESDKESLGKAMSLMGQQELIQVEEEARKIQNNVRGWLLRKNYVNLREAARSLQLAWREKKSKLNHPSHLHHGPSSAQQQQSPRMNGNHNSDRNYPNNGHGANAGPYVSNNRPTVGATHFSESTGARKSGVGGSGPSDADLEEEDRMNLEERAAATLQAATRRMIARKSFANLHKQTMASLTIQRNLVRWWTRFSNTNVATAQEEDQEASSNSMDLMRTSDYSSGSQAAMDTSDPYFSSASSFGLSGVLSSHKYMAPYNGNHHHYNPNQNLFPGPSHPY